MGRDEGGEGGKAAVPLSELRRSGHALCVCTCVTYTVALVLGGSFLVWRSAQRGVASFVVQRVVAVER